jgi:hypothetical protein
VNEHITTPVDIFAVDEAKAAASKAMHGLILAGAHRGEGPISHLTGGAPTGSPTTEQARERLSQALGDLESAERRKDPDDIDYCEHRLDKLIDESRASRQSAEDGRLRNSDGTFATAESYDGGVRRAPGQSRPTPGLQTESASQLFTRALRQSAQERYESGADERLVQVNT